MQQKAEKITPEILRIDGIKRGQILRKERGLTVEQLADYIGVSSATIRRWENRSHISSPSTRQIIALCKLYEVSPSWLLMGIGAKYMKEVEAEHKLKSAEHTIEYLQDLTTTADSLIKNLENRVARLGKMLDNLDTVTLKLERKLPND